MENNQEEKQFAQDGTFHDNFGNEYVVLNGKLKSVNGNHVKDVTFLYSSIDHSDKDPQYAKQEGQNKTMLIEVDLRGKELILNLHNNKQINLSSDRYDDLDYALLTVDRDFARLHNVDILEHVQWQEILDKKNKHTEDKPIEKKPDENANITYYYPPIKNGQRSTQVTHAARKGFEPIIANNMDNDERTFAEFFDVNKDEYYKGNISLDPLGVYLTKYHKLFTDQKGNNHYQKDWSVQKDFTDFCGLDNKLKQLYLYKTDTYRPLFSIINTNTGQTKITRSLSDKQYGHQPSLITDELNMSSLETHQQHWDRMNRFYNEKVQKVRDNIAAPLPLQPERSKSV